MKNFEIERKFLLRPCSPKRFLDILNVEYQKFSIQQYYLPQKDGVYVRYRSRNGQFFKTIKSGEGMVREEYESSVPKEEFEKHLDEHIGRVIEKNRFVFTYGGIKYEMDRFLGELKGLCYLEIEFGDRVAAEQFVLPEIFSHLYLAEVTEEKRFNNSSISLSQSIPVLDRGLEVLVKKMTHLLSTGEAAGDTKIAFGPFENSTIAISTILRDLAERLDKSRKSLIRYENDPEVLHKFRVSARRTISILGEFKSFFLPAWYDLHRRNISQLLDQTNEKRDIDVLLGKLSFYNSLLPKSKRKGLAPLKKFLLEKRDRFEGDIIALSKNELLNYEIGSLHQPRFTEKTATQPIVITAMHILSHRISRIIKKGEKLDSKSRDREYHKLRIQFKKLRYFVEVMKPLVDREKYDETMKMIKNMQVILGDFHDYQVQQSLLLTLHDDPALQKEKTRKVVKILINKLNELKERQGKLFRIKFLKFKALKKRSNRLFEHY